MAHSQNFLPDMQPCVSLVRLEDVLKEKPIQPVGQQKRDSSCQTDPEDSIDIKNELMEMVDNDTSCDALVPPFACFLPTLDQVKNEQETFPPQIKPDPDPLSPDTLQGLNVSGKSIGEQMKVESEKCNSAEKIETIKKEKDSCWMVKVVSQETCIQPDELRKTASRKMKQKNSGTKETFHPEIHIDKIEIVDEPIGECNDPTCDEREQQERSEIVVLENSDELKQQEKVAKCDAPENVRTRSKSDHRKDEEKEKTEQQEGSESMVLENGVELNQQQKLAKCDAPEKVRTRKMSDNRKDKEKDTGEQQERSNENMVVENCVELKQQKVAKCNVPEKVRTRKMSHHKKNVEKEKTEKKTVGVDMTENLTIGTKDVKSKNSKCSRINSAPIDKLKCRAYVRLVRLKMDENMMPIYSSNVKVIKREIDPYVCKVCGVFYTSEYELQKHMQKYKGYKIQQCNCGKAFTSLWFLQSHINCGSENCGFACDICGSVIKNMAKMEEHRLRHEHERLKQIAQELCDEYLNAGETNSLKQKVQDSFYSVIEPSSEKRKIALRSGNKRSTILDICKKHMVAVPSFYTFRSNSPVVGKSLKKGTKSFISVEIFNSCNFCKLLCKQLFAVATCKLMPEKGPFQCKECDCIYEQKCDFVCHMRVHKNENPCRCPNCGANFRTVCTLNIHKQCCSSCMICVNKLRRPVKCYHGRDRRFECKMCSRRFNFQNDLLSHLQTHV